MKQTTIYLFFCFFLFVGSMYAQSACTPYFSASSHQVAINDVVQLSISVDQYQDVRISRTSINWDPLVLQYLDTLLTSNDTIIPWEINQIDPTNGSMQLVTRGNSASDGRDSAILFQLEFRVIGDPGRGSFVSFGKSGTNAPVWGTDLSRMSFAAKYGRIYSDPFCTPFDLTDFCLIEPLCGSGNNAGVFFDHQGGQPAFTYLWTGPNAYTATEQYPSNISGGSYEVEVTDACGGLEKYICIIEDTPDIRIYARSIVNNQCAGDANGQLELGFHSDDSISFIQWSHGPTDTIVSNLANGIYTATVTNSQGCQAINSFEIESPDELLVETLNIVCDSGNGNGGAINICVSGGAQGNTYTWSNGATTRDLNGITSNPTPYYLTVTDQLGCTVVDSFSLLPNNQINSWTSDTIVCTGVSFQLNVDAPNATSIVWAPANLLSCNTCPNPIASIQETTTFSVTADFNSCSETRYVTLTADDCVWPGDTDTNKVVNNFDLLPIGIAMGTSGPIRSNASLAWMAQSATNWTESTPISQVNYKHIDTDGDGLISHDDTLGILVNWGSVHLFRHPIQAEDRNMSAPFYVQPDTLVPNSRVGLPLVLGDMTNPVEDAYGIAFSIQYDATKIVPGSVNLDFSNSWLGDVNTDLISIQKDFPSKGQVDIAVTRTDGINRDGFGELGIVHITIEDDIFFRSGGSESNRSNVGIPMPFSISNVRMINVGEEQLELTPIDTNAEIVKDFSTSIKPLANEVQLSVFPNPTNNHLIIQSKDQQIQQIQLFDLAGRQVLNQDHLQTSTSLLQLKQLAEGSYLLKVQTDQGQAIRRIAIVK